MTRYSLSGKALRDVAEAIGYAQRHGSFAAADQIEGSLFRAFQAIGEGRSPGHKRPDLTDKNVLFYFEPPYIVTFRYRANMARILRVVHDSRDLRKFL